MANEENVGSVSCCEQGIAYKLRNYKLVTTNLKTTIKIINFGNSGNLWTVIV